MFNKGRKKAADCMTKHLISHNTKEYVSPNETWSDGTCIKRLVGKYLRAFRKKKTQEDKIAYSREGKIYRNLLTAEPQIYN